MIAAEAKAMALFASFCPARCKPIIIADRGFGNTRWLEEVQKRGWHFVQRMARNHYAETEDHIGVLYELGIRRGSPPRDWGWGTIGEKEWGKLRLVTVFGEEGALPRTIRSLVALKKLKKQHSYASLPKTFRDSSVGRAGGC